MAAALAAVALSAMLLPTPPAGAAPTHDVSLTMAGPGEVKVGDEFTYILTVTNKPESATAQITVEVEDQVPPGMTVHSAYIPSTKTPCSWLSTGVHRSRETGTVQCRVGLNKTNKTEDSKTIEIVVSATRAGTFTNSASAFGQPLPLSVDIAPGDNRASVTTVVRDPSGPALSRLSIDDSTVKEGKAGTTANTSFKVSVTPPPIAPLSVDYATADNSAVAPDDYVSSSGRLLFAAGQAEQQVVVPVAGDDLYEPDEAFVINLSNPSGDAEVGDGQGKGAIVNDDTPPSVSIDDVVLTEGTEADFTVSLSTPSGVPASVRYNTQNDTAAAPGDYAPVSGLVTFAPGQTRQVITARANDDGANEPDEDFFVNLSSPDEVAIAKGRGVGTIVDSGAAPRISIDDVDVPEGGTGSEAVAAFSVSRAGSTSAPVTVSYATADDSAQETADYRSKSGSLTFAAGQRTATVSVTIVGDDLPEPDERFFVHLTAPTPGSTITKPQGTGTIVDDDRAPSLSISDQGNVGEGATGTRSVRVLTVTLSPVSPLPVTVDYATADGTATAPDDYASASGRLTFAPGQRSQNLEVTVEGDDLYEGDHDFFVRLSRPTSARIADGEGKVTIQDDDPLPKVYIDDVTVSEGKAGTTTDALFSVSLADGETATPATVRYRTSDGTATSPDDYLPGSGTLTFLPGQGRRESVRVKINSDNLDEDHETFVVELFDATGATILRDKGTGTISDYGGGGWQKVPVTYHPGDDSNPLIYLAVLEGPACRGATPPASCGSVIAPFRGPSLHNRHDYSNVWSFNPATDTWANTRSGKKYFHGGGAATLTLLRDGKVLMAGGGVCRSGDPFFPGFGCMPDSRHGTYAEVYDPGVTYRRPVMRRDQPPGATVVSHGEWREAGPMSMARSGHSATLLESGDVLMVGGNHGTSAGNCGVCPQLDPSHTAELYKPMSASFVAARPPLHPHGGDHEAVLLTDGRVLVLGGNDKDFGEIYDPAASGGLGVWRKTERGMLPRGAGFTATRLQDNTVLVVGGTQGTAVTDSVQLYNPNTDEWTDVAPVPFARSGHSATLLKSGKVLVAGGGGCSGCTGKDARLYEPSTRIWRRAAPMNLARSGHPAVLVTWPQGSCDRVLVGGIGAGGTEGAAEVYTPVDQVCETTPPPPDDNTRDDPVDERRDTGTSTENLPTSDPAPIPPEPQPQPQVHQQPQPQSQAQAQPQVQPQTQPQVQPQGQPQTQSQAQPQGQPQTQPQGQPQTQPQGQPQTQPQGQPQTQPQAEPQSQAQPQTQPQVQPQVGITGERQRDREVETEGADAEPHTWFASARQRPSPVGPLVLSWGAAVAMAAMGVGARFRRASARRARGQVAEPSSSYWRP